MYYNGCYYTGAWGNGCGSYSNSCYCCNNCGTSGNNSGNGCGTQHCCYCHCCQEAFERGFRFGIAQAETESDCSCNTCCSCSHRTYC